MRFKKWPFTLAKRCNKILAVTSQDFFKSHQIEKRGNREIAVSWVIPPSLFYIEGHFPGFPVLPGVAIIDISISLLQTQDLENSIALQSVVSAKFMQTLAPLRTVEIIATWVAQDLWDVEWHLLGQHGAPNEIAAQLRLQIF